MKDQFLRELTSLRKEVLESLKNQLVFTKTVSDVISKIQDSNEIEPEKLRTMKSRVDACLNDCLVTVEAKFIEAYDRVEQMECEE